MYFLSLRWFLSFHAKKNQSDFINKNWIGLRRGLRREALKSKTFTALFLCFSGKTISRLLQVITVTSAYSKEEVQTPFLIFWSTFIHSICFFFNSAHIVMVHRTNVFPPQSVNTPWWYKYKMSIWTLTGSEIMRVNTWWSCSVLMRNQVHLMSLGRVLFSPDVLISLVALFTLRVM